LTTNRAHAQRAHVAERHRQAGGMLGVHFKRGGSVREWRARVETVTRHSLMVLARLVVTGIPYAVWAVVKAGGALAGK
jgi:hypothetical protein